MMTADAFERLQTSLSKLKMHSPSIQSASVFPGRFEPELLATSEIGSSGHVRCSPSLSRLPTRAMSPLVEGHVQARSQSVSSKPKPHLPSGTPIKFRSATISARQSGKEPTITSPSRRRLTDTESPQGWRTPTPPSAHSPSPASPPPRSPAQQRPTKRVPSARESCAPESVATMSSFLHLSPKLGGEAEAGQGQPQKSKTRMRLKRIFSGWPLSRRASQMQRGEE